MKRILQITALIIALVSAIYWAAAGAHRGWTKTNTPVQIEDPVTGLTGIEYRKQFVPGIDFLLLTEFAAFSLAAGTFLIRKPSNKEQK